MADESFEEFVRANLPALGRYAYALVGPTDNGELVQETLVKVAGAWRRIRSDGNPLGYARTVMFRTYVSRWRRRTPPTIGLGDLDPPAPGDPYRSVDERDALDRALRDLSRDQRAVLVLTYLEQATDDEIAELLRRRPATVRSLRHRALISLRQRFAVAGPAAVGGDHGPA